ncbi:putative quinol monooxygenase [Rubinisphaera sp. JC750]|nr:antibiotic biosynthesis monooxygenase family protein [Rubinisphaera sp. JC750]
MQTATPPKKPTTTHDQKRLTNPAAFQFRREDLGEKFMFVINVILQVNNADDVSEVRDNLRRAGQLSRTEPGCHLFEVCQDQNNPQTFLLCERWESKQAWEVHREAEAFTTIYQPLVLPKVERTPYFCDLIE